MADPRLSAFDLSGRTALITGGGGLLGPHHAAALAELGARVVVTDGLADRADLVARNIASETKHANILSYKMDVTNEDEIQAVSDTVGPIDVLVNNAAIDAKVAGPFTTAGQTRLEAFSIDQWHVEIEVGLTGAMLCSRTFGACMAKRGHGVILNIASDLSVIAPDQRLYRKHEILEESQQPVKPVSYSVIKHGIIGLTKYLATYWAHLGVRVNALSPGGVRDGQRDDFTLRLSELIPMGRMARPDELRSAVQFLCSDASSYMNGQNIVIDGGRSIL